MEFGVVEILISLGVLLLCLYYYLTTNFDFWKKRKVQGPKPIPIFGNFKDVLLGNVHPAILIKKYYDEFTNVQLIGLFIRHSPVVVLKDPCLIKDIMIKDFNVFPERTVFVNIKSDPINENLLSLNHERWRPLRSRLSPVFTAGKLKDMFYLMVDCAKILEEYVNVLVEKDEPVECRDLTAKFTTDNIGSCVFGLNMNALNDENSEFRKFGRDMFASTFKNKLRRFLREMYPKIFEVLSPFIVNETTKSFARSVKETIEHRKTNKIKRNDFLNSLMELQSQPEKLNTFEFTDSLLIAQAILFFSAGFETSSTTMSNALYELALNGNIQDKLRAEITDVLDKNDNKLTYDSIKNMKYLDKIIKETMRKYPPGFILRRIALSPYTFSGTDVSIPKNTSVLIPVWAIHRDPEIYPNPEEFDPERFNEENERNRHPMHYLPFGDGPRNCIGARFSKNQLKIGIITLISNFKVSKCHKTCLDYRLEAQALVPTPIDGIHLKITKL